MPGSERGILVVGGGVAGQAVCEAMRARDFDVPLTLICGERHMPYDRVRLGVLLDPDADPDGLRLRPNSWYEDHNIEVLTDTSVEALDPDHGSAALSNGGGTVRFRERRSLHGLGRACPAVRQRRRRRRPRVPHPRGWRRDRRRSERRTARCGDRRRAARARGGICAVEAGLCDNGRPSRRPADGAPARRRRRGDVVNGDPGARRRGAPGAFDDRRFRRRRRSCPRAAIRRRLGTGMRAGRDRGRDPATRRFPPPKRPDGEPWHRRR